MSAAGGAPDPPGDAGEARGKPVQRPGELEKASLTLYDPSPPKSGKPGAERGTIDFQFNPKEVTIAKTAEWEREPATKAKKAGPPSSPAPSRAS